MDNRQRRASGSCASTSLAVLRRAGAVALVGLLTCGCIGGQATLEPAASAQAVRGYERGAFDADNGVLAIAQTESWDGDVVLSGVVTPVKLMLDNQRATAVGLKLEHVSLIDEASRVYRALPPRKITGRASMRQALPLYRPLDPYYFGTRESYQLPPPGARGYDTAFPADTGDPEQYYGYEILVNLPTRSMLSSAIVEGRLAPGEQNVGFLYFEPLPETPQSIVMRCDLYSDAGNARVARLRFPFVVTN